MASTFFIENQTVIHSDWANDVNNLAYAIFNNPGTPEDAREAINAVNKSGDTTEGDYTNTGTITTTNLIVSSDSEVQGNQTVIGETNLSTLNVSGDAAFSVSPTAPTPTSGDDSTKLATTEFVSDAVEAAVGEIVGDFAPIDSPNLTGTPTAPTAPIGVFTDQIATTEFVYENVIDSPGFTGTPRAPTPPKGDNSTRIATTEFVQNSIGSYSGFDIYTGSTTLTSAHIGHYIQGGSGGITFTLPNPTSMPAGARITIQASSGGSVSVTTPAGFFAGTATGGATISTLVLQPQTMCDFVAGPSPINQWFAVNGTGSSANNANGLFKLGSGIIVQWGTVSVAANTTSTFSFPNTFPNNAFMIVGSRRIGTNAAYNYGIVSTSQFSAQNNAASTESGSWIAIGN